MSSLCARMWPCAHSQPIAACRLCTRGWSPPSPPFVYPPFWLLFTCSVSGWLGQRLLHLHLLGLRAAIFSTSAPGPWCAGEGGSGRTAALPQVALCVKHRAPPCAACAQQGAEQCCRRAHEGHRMDAAEAHTAAQAPRAWVRPAGLSAGAPLAPPRGLLPARGSASGPSQDRQGLRRLPPLGERARKGSCSRSSSPDRAARRALLAERERMCSPCGPTAPPPPFATPWGGGGGTA